MAASYAITSCTYNSVTITVSGLTAGDAVRFYMRRDDSPGVMLYDVVYAATSTSMIRTFPPATTGDELAINECEYLYSGAVPLTPNTLYAVRIGINVESEEDWLDAQYFATEFTDHIVDIPILPSDFALFDWADWPDSRAALVSGEYTHNFRKEAWNAIVDRLAAALNTAGIKWDSLYAPVSVTKITDSYGDLYAAIFNSVRHNIDLPMPLGWAWAKTPSFRGYVGREDFKGVSIWGESQADDVYAEYILELVRKLNLLIGVMKGDKAALLAGGGIGHSVCSGGMVAKPSRPLAFSGLAFSQYEAWGLACQSRPLYFSELLLSDYEAKMRLPYVQRLRFAGKSLSNANAELIASRVKLVQSAVKSQTDAEAVLRKPYAKNFGHESLISSSHEVKLFASRIAGVIGKYISQTLLDGELLPVLPLRMTSGELAASIAEGVMATVPPLRINGSGLSVSSNEGKVVPIEALRASAKERVNTLYLAAAVNRQSKAVQSGELSGSVCSALLSEPDKLDSKELSATDVNAVLDSAWYPPIWVDGGLWIRQSHSVTQNENGELVIT